MFDIEPWTHAEDVNPMPHGGLNVAHNIPMNWLRVFAHAEAARMGQGV